MPTSSLRGFLKEHFVLIAGILLPLVLIVLLGLARMVTDATVDPPQYKAVYVQVAPGRFFAAGKFSYIVQPSGKLAVTWTGPQTDSSQTPPPPVVVRAEVIVFDPNTQSRQQYAFEVADGMKSGTVAATSVDMPDIKIEAGNMAPDGYIYEQDLYHSRSGIFFDIFDGGGHSDDRHAIAKNGKSFRLPPQDRHSQFDFLGWTK